MERKRLADSIANALECIVTFDARGVVVGLNPAARVRFGYSDDALGRLHLRELIVDGYERLHRFVDRRGMVELCDVRGAPFPADLRIDVSPYEPTLAVAVIRDRTAHRLLQLA